MRVENLTHYDYIFIKCNEKEKKTVFTIYRMIDQDNDIKLSKRDLMVAHKLLNQGLLFQVF